MTPADFVAAVSPQFQNIGALHYFGPKAKAAAESLGIDQFRFYFAGRGGVLGEVDTEVMLSTFGYFNPDLVAKMWSTSKERCDVTAAATAQLQVAYDIGDELLADVEGLAESAAALGVLMNSVDVAGLPLFAGFLAQPVPTSPAHAFMHQAILFRELRGSIHLAAIAAAGCRSRVAHQIRRPNDLEMFGYTEPIEVPDAERAAYDAVEPLTNAAMVVHCTSALTADQRDQIAAAADAATAAVSGLLG